MAGREKRGTKNRWDKQKMQYDRLKPNYISNHIEHK